MSAPQESFINICIKGDLEKAKSLYSTNKEAIDIHAKNEQAFRYACENGHLEVAKFLITLGDVNIHAQNEQAFRWACENGHLEVAKWLYSLGDVNIHVHDEQAFRWACEEGHLEVAKWLYSLGDVNIHAQDEHAFCFACECHCECHLEIVKLLITLGVVPSKDNKHYNFYLQHRENLGKLNKYFLRETYKHKFATQAVSMIISKYL